MKDKHFKDNILVVDIPDEGLSITYADMPGLLSDTDECRQAGPIEGEVSLNHVDGGIDVRGKVRTTVSLKCHRCLDSYEFPVEHDFSFMLVTRGKEEGNHDGATLESEELDVSFFDGKKIDLGEIFREEILLRLPMQQLCSENCKGLCSRCGANLNRETCACRPDRANGPFAALKKLKTENR